jgi:hypothetical protein
MAMMSEPITYPREAVVTIKQVAAALGVSTRHVERMDLPTVYLGARTRRYVWNQILETLAARAK